MLTLEEARWSLKVYKMFSTLCFLPIEVDVNTGKVQRQSNKVKVYIWNILFGVGVSLWLYIFMRLLNLMILEPEKYFRWDNFIMHYGATCGYGVWFFTGFCLFLRNPQENIMVFNHLFSQREDPVQKILDQQLEMKMQKSRNGNGNEHENPGFKTRVKSRVQPVSTSASAKEEVGQNEVTENQPESESKVTLPRPLLTWPLQYSLDELGAKLLPLVSVYTWFLGMLFFAIDPTRPQLLFTILPPEYQNPYSFFTLWTVVALSMCTSFLIAAFAVVAQIMFFAKCQLQFQRMSLQLKKLEEKFQMENPLLGGQYIQIRIPREIWILRQILQEIRELVLFIELFNRCFPFCIFACKIGALAVSIVYYFFVIRHHENSPFLAVIMGYTAVMWTLTYSLMYNHAHSVPGKMEELKQEFLLTAQKTTKASASNANFNTNVNGNGNKNTNILWAEMKREIKRIRSVGIKVGNFHQMERETTPNFVNFVVNQVVSLLVAFP